MEDQERGYRNGGAFCFKRDELRHFPPHRLSYIGFYVPMNLRFMLEVIILFTWMCITISRTLDLYGVVKEMISAMNAMMSPAMDEDMPSMRRDLASAAAKVMNATMTTAMNSTMTTAMNSTMTSMGGGMSGMGGGMSGMDGGMSGMDGGMMMMMPPMMMDMIMKNAPLVFSEMETVIKMYGAAIMFPMCALQKFVYTKLVHKEFNVTPLLVVS